MYEYLNQMCDRLAQFWRGAFLGLEETIGARAVSQHKLKELRLS